MRNRWAGTAAAVISVLSFLTFITGCSATGRSPRSQSRFCLGTQCTITIYGSLTEDLFDVVFGRIREIEEKMSRDLERSEVSRVNSEAGNRSVRVSEDTYSVVSRSLELSRLSKGAFDVTVGPLVTLWDIGGEKPEVPSAGDLGEALSHVGYEAVRTVPDVRSVYLETKGMELDLGGIAKGYAADEAVRVLRTRGVRSGIIDLGGNVLVMGTKPGDEPWRIGIQNPFQLRGEYLGVIETVDRTVVTSGVYERFFEQNGKRYHHILDPETGYPVENSLMSVTVTAANSMDADGLSTAVFVLGRERGRELIESLNGIEAVFVTRDREVFLTSGLDDDFTLTHPDFRMGEK